MMFDDINNILADPLGILFLLDDRLVPAYLDYAQTKGNNLDQEVLFLLEVDRLRFCINSNNIDNSNNNNNNDTIIEVNDAIEFMNRIINYKCIDSILDENEMIGLRKLIEIKLPLKSSFAEICERLWIKVLTITEQMPLSSNWTILRKYLIDDIYINNNQDKNTESENNYNNTNNNNTTTNKKFELFTILNDEQYRRYFHQYLLRKNNININDSSNSFQKSIDLASYHCWLDVREILSKLEKLKNTINFDYEKNNISDDDNNINNNNNDDDQDKHIHKTKQINNLYEDDLEAFKLLLREMRSLHKRFGFTMLPTSSSPLVVPIYTSYIPNIPSSLSTTSSSSSSSSTTTTTIPLHKLSPTICIDLSATISLCSSISLADIDSVDINFANTCVTKFHKLLVVLERETFQHLQQQFEGYLQSLEFVKMIIRKKCTSNMIPQIQKYLRTIKFLENINKVPGSIILPHSIIYDNEIESMSSNVLVSYSNSQESIKSSSISSSSSSSSSTPSTSTSSTTSSQSSYLGNLFCIYCELEATFENNYSIANIRLHKGEETISESSSSSLSSNIVMNMKFLKQFSDNHDHNLKLVLNLLKHLGKVDITNKSLNTNDSKFILENSSIYSTELKLGQSCSLMKISRTYNATLYKIICSSLLDHFSQDHHHHHHYHQHQSYLQNDGLFIQVGYALEKIPSASTSNQKFRLGLVVTVPSKNPSMMLKMIKDIARETAISGQADCYTVKSINLSSLQLLSSSSSSSPTIQSNQQESLKDLYPYAYKDHNNHTCYNPSALVYGPIDFSIKNLIFSTSLRLFTHILFLLLANKNVVLISYSASSLTEIMLTLPRLIQPFRLYYTHDFDMLMQLDMMEIWWSNVLSGDIQLKRSFLVGLKADIFYTSSMYKYLLYNQASSMKNNDSNSTRRNEVVIEKHTNIEESFDMIVVDIDRCTIIFPSEIDRTSLSVPAFDASDNNNDNTFQLPFSFCGHSITMQFKSSPFIELQKTLQILHINNNNNNNNNRTIDMENDLVEVAWLRYIAKVILKELPQQIIHYPSQGIIGCNIDNMITNIQNSYFKKKPHKYNYDIIDSTSSILKCEDIELFFLKDLISNVRPAFLDLIKRHGNVLKQFRF